MAKLLRDIVEKITADKRLEGKNSSEIAPPDIDQDNFYNWKGGKDGVAFIKKHKTETHDYPQDTASFKGKKGDMKKAAYKAAPQDTYEEVEQIDEAKKESKFWVKSDKLAAAHYGRGSIGHEEGWAPAPKGHKGPVYTRYVRDYGRGGDVQYGYVKEKNPIKEEEQIDEISAMKAIKTAVKRQAGAYGASIERGDELTDREQKKVERSQNLIKNKYGLRGTKIVDKAVGGKIGYYAEEEHLDEKLTKGMSAGEVISDFVHSDDPKFAGKSKKERMRMALGAYYSMNPSKSRKKMEEAATCNMSEAGKMCEVHGEAECPGYRAERKGGRKLLLGGKKKMEEGVMDTIKDLVDPHPPEKYTPKFETDPKKMNPNTGTNVSPEDREALKKKIKDTTNEGTDPNLAVPMLESGKKSKKKMKNEQAAPYDGGIVPNPTGASYSSIGRDGAV